MFSNSAMKNEGGIIPFFKSLLPNFEKGRLVSDVESTFKEMKITREMYMVIPGDYIPVIKTKFSALDKAAKNSISMYRGDMISLIANVIDERLKEKDNLMDYIDDTFSKVVLKETLDYQKVNLLRYIEGISFFNTYARKLILVATNYRVDDRTVSSVVDKMNEAYVNDAQNIKTFVAVLSSLTSSVNSVKTALSKMANVTFNPDMHNLILRQQGANTDPLAFGFLPIIGTVTYKVGLAINLYLSRRQELAQEEAEKLKLTVLLLRRKAESTVDVDEVTKLTKQIEYYNNRINKISASIEDMSEGD